MTRMSGSQVQAAGWVLFVMPTTLLHGSAMSRGAHSSGKFRSRYSGKLRRVSGMTADEARRMLPAAVSAVVDARAVAPLSQAQAERLARLIRSTPEVEPEPTVSLPA